MNIFFILKSRKSSCFCYVKQKTAPAVHRAVAAAAAAVATLKSTISYVWLQRMKK